MIKLVESYYVWMGENELEGEHSICAVIDFTIGPMVLMSPKKKYVELMRPIAIEHAKRTGEKVKLVKFIRSQVEEL